LKEQLAKPSLGGAEIRRQSEGIAIGSDRGFVVASGLKGDAQVLVDLGDFWSQGEGTPQDVDSLAEMSIHQVRTAEAGEDVGVVRSEPNRRQHRLQRFSVFARLESPLGCFGVTRTLGPSASTRGPLRHARDA
jgi:hypothetical protein